MQGECSAYIACFLTRRRTRKSHCTWFTRRHKLSRATWGCLYIYVFQSSQCMRSKLVRYLKQSAVHDKSASRRAAAAGGTSSPNLAAVRHARAASTRAAPGGSMPAPAVACSCARNSCTPGAPLVFRVRLGALSVLAAPSTRRPSPAAA